MSAVLDIHVVSLFCQFSFRFFMFYFARCRENNLHDRITFVKGRLEDLTLPVEKVNDKCLFIQLLALLLMS